MAEFKSYCAFVKDLDAQNVHRLYHDNHYGFPVDSDDELFGRLILEINQAGLSWETILKKESNFRKAYSKFSITQIASYTEDDRARLLGDSGIIRNRLKVNAAIHNAQVVQTLQKAHGSFKNWLDHHMGKNKAEWVQLFKKTFKFTGGEITNEFLMSSGYLPGAHENTCPIHQKCLDAGASWNQ